MHIERERERERQRDVRVRAFVRERGWQWQVRCGAWDKDTGDWTGHSKGL